jgi:hypothetical protein
MVRNILTTYYLDKKLVKTCRAKHAGMAVLHAVHHLQQHHYEATLCEVFDGENGVLHAVLKKELVKGERLLQVVYKRSPEGVV